jgi:hypothetical protein
MITTLATLAALTQPATAATFETQALREDIVFDIKAAALSTPLDITVGNVDIPVGLIGRSRITTTYEGDIQGIAFPMLTIGKAYGCRPLGQARFMYSEVKGEDNVSLTPQAGLLCTGTYFKDTFDLKIWPTVSIGEDSVTEIKIDPTHKPQNDSWYVPDRIGAEIFLWTPTLELHKPLKGKTRFTVGYEPIDGLLMGPAIEIDYANEVTAKPRLSAEVRL